MCAVPLFITLFQLDIKMRITGPPHDLKVVITHFNIHTIRFLLD